MLRYCRFRATSVFMLNKEKAMKKINFFIGFTVLAFVGCKNGTEYSPNYTFDAENNVNVSYYQKDAKADLLSFLQDGSSRSAYTVGSEENTWEKVLYEPQADINIRASL